MPNSNMPRHWRVEDGEVASTAEPFSGGVVDVTINVKDPAHACWALYFIIQKIFAEHVYDDEVLRRAEVVKRLQALVRFPVSRAYGANNDEVPF